MNETDDWYDVEPLPAGGWRIAEAIIFNNYLLEGDDRALLIDAGGGVGDLRSVVEELTDLPVTLLLSHSHWDHIGAGYQFDDVVADERAHDDGTVVAGGLGYGPDDWVEDWLAAGQAFPDGFDPEGFEIEPVTGVETVSAGETIDLGGRELELVALPGHAPGQLGVLDREAGEFYGADVIHHEYELYVHFEGCDLADYVDTFDRVIELRDSGAFDTLYISHARPLSGDDLSLLDEFRDGLREVLAGEREYERVEEGVPARRYEIAGQNVYTKPDVS